MVDTNKLIIAVPKGRIYEELAPLFNYMDLKPEDAFFDEDSRLLAFNTNHDDVAIIRVRSFDVATYVAFGGAHIGVAGSDVLDEFNYPDIYVPLDINIGHCRMSIAAKEDVAADKSFWQQSHIRVATKYPHITQDFFAKKGVQAECIKLNGAIELAPKLNLSQCIVDLVSSGRTLKDNGLKEIETIMDISSKLIVNRGAFKTRNDRVKFWVDQFEKAVADRDT